MTLSSTRQLDFSSTRILVVGDLMLDKFRYGSVSRVSPEAPVPVIHVKGERSMLGGAGNVLANIGALGANGDLIAVVGEDSAGQTCADLIADHGGNPELLVRTSARPTTLKSRYVSGSQQLLRCDEEDASPLAHDIVQQLIARIDSVIDQYDIIAISDYAKGVLCDEVVRHVITKGRALGKAVIIDPKRRDFEIYRGASVIKPNRSELSLFANLPCPDFHGSGGAAQLAMEKTGAAILLTMSEQGMALFRPDMVPVHLHATATEVFDVSGAGDTALAIFCCALASDMAMDEAAMLANIGAGVIVRKLGTATLTLAELAAEIGASDGGALRGVCSLEEVVRQVSLWKGEGLRVGFTNGCFDIVHVGHVTLLRQARALCDRLVVGLNSDASVRRLKGVSRPIQSEYSRAEVLAAIDAVDLVVIFDDDTPLNVITEIRPTDLIKGADYKEEDVVGATEVKRGGGRVHLIHLVPGHSTTAAVERIKAGTASAAATLSA